MTRPIAPVPEEVIRLLVNGRSVLTWTGSPTALVALAAGRLMALGYVRSSADLLSLEVTGGGPGGTHQIDAAVTEERAAAAEEERRHRCEHGCGLRFLLDCRPDAARPPGAALRAPVPATDGFPDLFRSLFERSPARRESGGHHTTALSDGGRLVHVHEEVGRHNGADKAIGAALLKGEDLGRVGLITTARISGEIAEKAVRAGLAWVASRSVPTTLAVEIAAAGGVPLVGRAASPEARVFEP